MYFVWGEDGNRPKFRHETLGAAKIEAQRLAALNPGHKFFVVSSVGYAIKPDSEWHDNCDEIPF